MPWVDQDGLHDIYRSWRQVIDVLPRRAGLRRRGSGCKPLTRLARTWPGTSSIGLQLRLPRHAVEARRAARRDRRRAASIGAAAAWVLSNHDVTRHLTRYGRAGTGSDWQPDPARADLALGTRRARAAIMLSLALPGSAYLYQGEELGLWEVEDLPDELSLTRCCERTGRLPPRPRRLPRPAALAGRRARLRLRPAGGEPPGCPSRRVAAAGRGCPGPGLRLDARALPERAAHQADRRVPGRRRVRVARRSRWRPGVQPRRGFGRAVNISGAPVPLPPHDELLLTSAPLESGLLPPEPQPGCASAAAVSPPAPAGRAAAVAAGSGRRWRAAAG